MMNVRLADAGVRRDAAPLSLALASAIDPRAVRQVLGVLPVPALLLDGERAICHVNAAAAPHLNDPLCIVIAGGRVCRFAGASSEPFNAVFQRAFDGQSSVVAVTVVSGQRCTLWRVSLAPLHARGDARRVIVLLEPPLSSLRALPLLERLFGLTPAEARVLALLLDDRRPKEIARALDIEVTTVRSHLKSLFLKTGTHRQGELIGLALSAA